jgi:hypothetical protein
MACVLCVVRPREASCRRSDDAVSTFAHQKTPYPTVSAECKSPLATFGYGGREGHTFPSGAHVWESRNAELGLAAAAPHAKRSAQTQAAAGLSEAGSRRGVSGSTRPDVAGADSDNQDTYQSADH